MEPINVTLICDLRPYYEAMRAASAASHDDE